MVKESCEFHFVLDVGSIKAFCPDRAAVRFSGANRDVQMQLEEDGIFGAVVMLTPVHCYTYRYVVWHDDEWRREEEDREVIPSKKREIIIETFNEYGECFFSFFFRPSLSINHAITGNFPEVFF